MDVGGKRCLLCDCEGTAPLDGAALARALGAGAAAPVIHHQLCRAQLDRYREALAGGGPLLVGCTQEAPLFTDVAAEAGAGQGAIAFTNLRERAGWSDEGAAAQAKVAALLAEAAIEIPPAPELTLRSEGNCLVVGPAEPALEAAKRLADRLAVTLLLAPGPGDDALPPVGGGSFPILSGRVRRLTGHLGAFEVEVAGLAAAAPSSRGGLRFLAPATEPGALQADLVLDLSGGTPLFPAHEKRDGYLRPDPRDPLAVERALFAATALVGEFEKPRYVAFSAELCVHSRSRKTGCTRCLDQCPTGAITPAGDTVSIDPYACAGCGSCAGVCPTGAATYADPGPNALLERMRALLGTYLGAGGRDPVLLVHEARHGDELIGYAARTGRGLPARVLPFAVGEIAQLGLEALAGAVAYGASTVVLLVPPRKEGEVSGLRATAGYVTAILDAQGYGPGRLVELATDDPDRLEALLWWLPRPEPVEAAAYLPMGKKRTLARLALDHLHDAAPAPADLVPLPPGAPFGRLRVDVEGCTLCLACVGACPTGALLDNPDKPTLRFLEDNCVQCGLCASTCPERVISLEPRLSFLPEAKQPIVVKEEEPALCVRCAKPFGTRSSIERIVSRLAERHAMFMAPAQVDLIRMCDDCRVAAQFARADNPMAGGAKPRVRTSEDYLREREDRPGGERR